MFFHNFSVATDTIQVDENWNLKICDFGLSAVKRTDTLSDNGAAPGTPLWMSPEVLRGNELNEKADVYSFAIVCWEIFERKEPFENHDSYSTFVNAVCNLKERPPLSEKMHPALRKLISDCWDEDMEKRPSFSQIIAILEELTITCTLKNVDAQNLWKKACDKKDSIPYRKFAARLWNFLELGSPDEDSIPYHCVQAVLAQAKMGEETGMPNILERGVCY